MPPRPHKKYHPAEAAPSASAASASPSLLDRMDENILADISLQLGKQDYRFFGQVNSSINATLKDRAYITEAINQIREQDVPFSCLSKALRSDPEVIEAALQYDGLNLKYLSKKLQNNEEMVRIAVDQNRNAALFASDELKIALALPIPSVAKQLF
ncbi:MAG: DUF4116 domain-containing protein [Gammaproteobacteria bacterium]|nr:DUF4116 domain-containing protein [Gammaproteobacteria bacterium]MCH9716188.1 DUF4116 domain-containing protein [Gammaproteobacteria bacterium]MCH9763924.1 DUF4116 domain-containing protein [Gammaproteobacteria bacterium]